MKAQQRDRETDGWRHQQISFDDVERDRMTAKSMLTHLLCSALFSHLFHHTPLCFAHSAHSLACLTCSAPSAHSFPHLWECLIP